MKILLDTNSLIWTAYKNDYNRDRINHVKHIIFSKKMIFMLLRFHFGKLQLN